MKHLKPLDLLVHASTASDKPQLIYHEPAAAKDRWKTYIGCRLKTLVLRWMALRIETLSDILCKSGTSLETLHVEMVHELDGPGLGTTCSRLVVTLLS